MKKPALKKGVRHKKALPAKKKSSKHLQRQAYLYMGVILGVLAIFMTFSIPDASMVKGASTTTISSNNSFFGSVSSFFSEFMKTLTHSSTTSTTTTSKNTTSTKQEVLSQEELLAMADNTYADGNLPLGDNKYVTDNSKKGYIYLCNTGSDEGVGGSDTDGPWIHGNTWNIQEKIAVSGKVSWREAAFENLVSANTRSISGNDLPISHTTGTFPIGLSDPAHTYDKNPNSIASQTLKLSLPTNPTYLDMPYCMGGEVGIMLSGVVLFNGFDAMHRDAAAHEVQDSCQGHPQVSSEYHYHSLSSCISDVSETTVVGFALDGFPITGPKVAKNKYLTTDDLDDCHGITSEITLDGKKTTIYHYVMTQDFPYSASCFRGKPVSYQVISAQMNKQSGQMQGNGMQGSSAISGKPQQMNMQQGSLKNSNNGMKPQPPQEAITACLGKTANASCSFTTPRGTISGTCKTPPGNATIVCVPSEMPR